MKIPCHLKDITFSINAHCFIHVGKWFDCFQVRNCEVLPDSDDKLQANSPWFIIYALPLPYNL